MHFVWFSMWDRFFSPRVSESRPSRVATRVGFGDEWWEIHLTWKTIQNEFSRILYTLKHFNQAKYNVQSCRSWKPCEMDLSHNCSLHGRMSEVCEKCYYDVSVSFFLVHPVHSSKTARDIQWDMSNQSSYMDISVLLRLPQQSYILCNLVYLMLFCVMRCAYDYTIQVTSIDINTPWLFYCMSFMVTVFMYEMIIFVNTKFPDK